MSFTLPGLRALLPLALCLTAACENSPEPLDRPITFTLRNELSTSVYTQVLGCDVDGWLTVLDRDGQPLGFNVTHCSNICGEEPVLCAEAAAICVQESARELSPGGKITRQWNGIYGTWNEQRRCTELHRAQGELRASACWGTAALDSQGRVADEHCKTVGFTVAEGSEVHVSTIN